MDGPYGRLMQIEFCTDATYIRMYQFREPVGRFIRIAKARQDIYRTEPSNTEVVFLGSGTVEWLHGGYRPTRFAFDVGCCVQLRGLVHQSFSCILTVGQ